MITIEEYKLARATESNAEGRLTIYQINEIAEMLIASVGCVLKEQYADICLVDEDLIAGTCLIQALKMLRRLET